MSTPEPRPALSRASDADLHPVSGKPVPAVGATGQERTLGKGKGATTSDTLRGPAKDKLVDLGVRVPKSVRKRLRTAAKERDITVDDLVARILDSSL